MTVECARCGVPFEREIPSQKYCADCIEPAHKDAQARWYRARHPKYKPDYQYKKPGNGKTVAEINHAAVSLGLSYGQYVTKYGV